MDTKEKALKHCYLVQEYEEEYKHLLKEIDSLQSRLAEVDILLEEYEDMEVVNEVPVYIYKVRIPKGDILIHPGYANPRKVNLRKRDNDTYTLEKTEDDFQNVEEDGPYNKKTAINEAVSWIDED